MIDNFGNPIDKRSMPIGLRGLSATKRRSLVRQAIAIQLCLDLHLPPAHEKLDFAKKTLQDNGKRQKRAVTPEVDGAACPGSTKDTVVAATLGAAIVIARRAIGFQLQQSG